MENNSNAIAEIQKKYAGCNLLMPAATEVQLNPFYKITVMEVTADLSENSGDIFKVGSVKTGTTQQGKDIWEETYSPAKPLLMKIAAAAGIQFDPDHTYGTKIDANTYKAKAYGAMRMPDGTGKTHADEKVICLDDEEANYRVEFMDKSIKGITDEKAAKAAAEMFKGNWIDAKNKWGKACRAFCSCKYDIAPQNSCRKSNDRCNSSCNQSSDRYERTVYQKGVAEAVCHSSCYLFS